jgi:hypothetical protein
MRGTKGQSPHTGDWPLYCDRVCKEKDGVCLLDASQLSQGTGQVNARLIEAEHRIDRIFPASAHGKERIGHLKITA